VHLRQDFKRNSKFRLKEGLKRLRSKERKKEPSFQRQHLRNLVMPQPRKYREGELGGNGRDRSVNSTRKMGTRAKRTFITEWEIGKGRSR